MVSRTLANKCPTPEAVLNLNLRDVAKLLEMKESITQRDRWGGHFCI
jgi:endonuclease III